MINLSLKDEFGFGMIDDKIQNDTAINGVS